MKMETPKMDVVRFQEADVLAASSPLRDTAMLGAWGNQAQDNSGDTDGWAKINGGNTHTYSELQTLAKERIYSNSTFWAGNDSTTINDLLANDTSDSRTFDGSIFNGNYESSDGGVNYYRQ